MDVGEVRSLIEETKRSENSWKAFERLAVLCSVRAELDGEPRQAERASFAAVGQSEFARAAAAAPPEVLAEVLEEHFECIRALYPKEYESVVRRLTTF